MNNNYDNASTLVEIYNNAYKSYLDKVNPNTFLHTMLLNILKSVEGTCSIILGYDQDTFGFKVISRASNKVINENDQSVYNDHLNSFVNHLTSANRMDNSSLMMRCVENKEILIETECSGRDIIGQNASNALQDSKHKSVILIPCTFNRTTNCLIIICKENICALSEKISIKNYLKILPQMLGVLMHNIINFPTNKSRPNNESNNIDEVENAVGKKSDQSFSPDSNSKIYNLVYDALSLTTDAIAITDKDLTIVYRNEQFNTMIKNRYNMAENLSGRYLIDIIPQTIMLIGNGDSSNTFYRNKKIDIDTGEPEFFLEVNVSSTLHQSSTYHIMKFTVKTCKDQHEKTCNSSKNLIAYLSHELRNPVQAITTGVYLIDLVVKKLNDQPVTSSPKNGLHNKFSPKRSYIDRSDCDNIINGEDFRSQIADLIDNDPVTLNSPPMIFKNINTSATNLDDSVTSDTKTFHISDIITPFTQNRILTSFAHNVMNNAMNNAMNNNAMNNNAMNNNAMNNNAMNASGFEELLVDHSHTSSPDKQEIIGKNISSNDSINDLSGNELKNSVQSIDSDESLDIFDSHDGHDDERKAKGLDTLSSVLKRVNSACKNMNIIIDDILDLSKIDNDELIMNLDEHLLRDITDLIVDESKPEALKKGLQIEYEFSENNPEYIYTDSTRIFQILSNLISNSIKYSNTGVIKFKVNYDNENNNIVFQVIDQGKGIRKEELSSLFKEFGRTSNSVGEINSTGLGLCVCQKLANLLGGSIEVTSEYKKGSTFKFVHPIKLGYSGSSILTEPVFDKDIKGDILIVDDDPNITSLFKLLLRCMNYDKGYELNIETASSGEKAVFMCKRKKYDLIFMDIDLDGEDGCIVCERILTECNITNTNSAPCPIIAVTANIKSVQKDRDEKFNLFADVVLKPFSNRDIVKIITKYLNRANV